MGRLGHVCAGIVGAALLLLSGCSGTSANDLRKDYFAVEITTHYQPRGSPGEPNTGSPCDEGCTLAFRVEPATGRFAPATGTDPTGHVGQDNASAGDASRAGPPYCAKDPSPIKDGGVTIPCGYYGALDGHGAIEFWVAKEPKMFLSITDVSGQVDGPISNCQKPTYYAVPTETYQRPDGKRRTSPPRLNITSDASVEVTFSIRCFAGTD